MALLNSLFSGISGLRNHQTMMDVIGNNVANANTIGFKSSRVTFADTFNQLVKSGTNPTDYAGGTNSFQVGLGVKTNSIDRNWAQGTFERTGIITDMALQGPGLFVLKSNGQNVYSRAGGFSFDQDGRLVNPQNGAVVQGKVANAEGAIPPGNNLEDIMIDTSMKLPAVATTAMKWGGNLDASASTTRSEEVEMKGNIQFEDPDGDGIRTAEKQVTVYNKYGEEYTYKITFTETANGSNQYNAEEELTDKDGNVVLAANPLGMIEFDPATNELTAASQTNLQSTVTVDTPDFLDFNFNGSSLTNDTNQADSVSFMADAGREPTIVSGTMTVYDSLGNQHEVTLKFTKSEVNNEWNWKISVPDSSTEGEDNAFEQPGSLTFNSDGSLDPTQYAELLNVEFTPTGGAEGVNIKVDLGSGFDGLTQLNNSSVVSGVTQDGAPPASLTNLNIDQFGNIEGVFSNGKSKALAQLMVANFKNRSGLVSIGDNMFLPRANAGEAMIQSAGEESSTTIQSGALEQSNVDLSDEFTKMIIAQRGFQSNARVISTSDNILQEITNLVR